MNDRDAIIELLARYARALEDRDGEALVAVFAPDGEMRAFSRFDRADYVAHDTDVVGHDALRTLFDGPLSPGAGRHYLTTDHIVDVAGDEARLRARFAVLESSANPRPDDGWPSGAKLTQGELRPLMIGYYDSHLRKGDGGWLFTCHQIKHSMPLTFPLKP
jgi:hypothetical protein